jgi:N-acetylmuramoyl-L-alanine amidase/GH25 family lysozyme M1 (1,4-beta-N-acetylmuramidase)
MSTMTVVIDAGHGGAERAGGSSPNNATGPNGLREKDLTLDLARRVAGALDDRFAVTLTRSGDANASLMDRARVAKDADADAFLSIHFNGASDPGADGSEAWVAKSSNSGSNALARALLDRVVAVTRGPDRGVREADLGVLLPARQGARTAATLLEVAFLTNPQEAERLAHDDYRQSLAQAIADGIADRLPAKAAVAQTLERSARRIDGVDCTSGNRLPSWDELREDGIQFVLLKASEGRAWIDDGFHVQAGEAPRPERSYRARHDGARAGQFLVGAYHYPWGVGALADAPQLFCTQADNFIGFVERLLPGDLPPTLDFEEAHLIQKICDAAGKNCTDGADDGVPWRAAQWLAPLESYLDRVETALGRVPMIYTSRRIWLTHLHDDPAFARFGDYPLWTADYMAHPPAIAAADRYATRLTRDPLLPAPWSDWMIWQYAGDFTPTGDDETPHLRDRDRKMDMDVVNGGIHVLRGLADLGRPAPHGDTPRFVAYAEEDGEIKVLAFLGFWIETSLTELARDPDAAHGPRAAGDVAACQIGNREYVAFRGRDDGHVYELARELGGGDGTATVTDVTGAAVAVNDPTYLVDGANRALVYWAVDDHQYLAVTVDGAWQRPLDVQDGTGMDVASGAATLYAAGGDVHVVGRAGRDGRLQDASLRNAWLSTSTWSGQAADRTSAAGAPPATYQPSTYADPDGRRHLVFRALRGEIHDIDDRDTDVSLSQQAGAPTCAGNPAAFVLAGVAHVVYRRPDGALHEIHGDGGGGWADRPLPCPQAAADPAVTVGSDGAFVVFRGRDGLFHEARLQADTWSCEAIAPSPGATASALATPTPVIETADTPLVPPERIVPAQACGVGKNPDGTYTTRVPEVVLIHSLDSAAGYAGEIANWRDGVGSERCFPPHYVIRNDGEITQMVAEKYISAHAGTWPMNVRAIGIEHDGYDNDPSYLTEAMYVSSAALVREICARWSIPVDRAHIIGHAEVPNQIKGHEHGDPGGYWDWDYYMALVRWDPADAAQKPLRQIVDTRSIAPGAAWNSEDRDSGRADWAATRHNIGPLFYSGYGDRYLWADGSADAPDDDAVEFTFTAPRAGHWAVSAWWPILSSANPATAIQIVPPDADQAVTQPFDQHVADWRRVWRTAALPAMPTWGLVGGVDLQQNDVVKVRVLRKSDAPGRVIADAVRFVNF